jgi:uroporphyrinogen decarboxylase
VTEAERVEALLQHKRPDRVAVWPFGSASGFAATCAGISMAEIYNSPLKALDVQRKASRDFGWAIVPMLGYASFGGWEFGGDIKWPDSEFSQAPLLTRHAVQNEEDAWKLKRPDVTTAGIIPLQLEFYRLALLEKPDNEPFSFIAFIGGPFTAVTNICGMNTLARWLVKKPAVVHHLLRLATDFEIELTKYLAALFGTERALPFCGEASTDNRLISPKIFAELALPYNLELHQHILAQGFKHVLCHICGEQNANLSHWSKVPMGDPGIVSIGHEIPLIKAAEYFPHDIIMGNLEPVIIQEKTVDEVYQRAKKVLDEGLKLTSGFIFSPGCGIPPHSPAANVMAMTRAVNDSGWYKR